MTVRHHTALGLDCGDSSGKAVLLSRRGNGHAISGLTYLSQQQEGLIAPEELSAAFADWLIGNRLSGHPACCGLPQSEVNTLVSDFPPIHSRSKLAKLVSYQTRQLGGLSGEDFVHDFQPLPALSGQTNPVLLAICRADFLDQRLAFHEESAVAVEQFTGNGLALANAFEALHPVAAAKPELQLLLDAGSHESILALYWQGRLQLVGALPLGLPDTSETDLADACLNFLQRWLDSLPGLAAPQLRQIWLSGGGALSAELPAILSRRLDAPVSILGVPIRECPTGSNGGPETAGVYPCLTVAYGLALQALGVSRFHLALLPESLLWKQRRRDALPYLLLAILLLILAASFHITNRSQELNRRLTQIQLQEAEAEACLRTIPQLENAYQQIAYQQRRMLPVVEVALRSQRYIETLQCWVQARNANSSHAGDWCIYLADEFAFQDDNRAQETAARPAEERRSARASARAAAETAAQESVDSPPVYPPVIPVSQLPVLGKMYIAGLAPTNEGRYQIVKEFQNALNATDAFTKVDDQSASLTPHFRETFLAPWQQFLANGKMTPRQEYTIFFLQLPFRDSIVNRPAAQ